MDASRGARPWFHDHELWIELFVLANLPAQTMVLLENLVAFQGGQLTQLQAHHRLGLGFRHEVDVLRTNLFLQRAQMFLPEDAQWTETHLKDALVAQY